MGASLNQSAAPVYEAEVKNLSNSQLKANRSAATEWMRPTGSDGRHAERSAISS
jgi:hypothetical protein